MSSLTPLMCGVGENESFSAGSRLVINNYPFCTGDMAGTPEGPCNVQLVLKCWFPSHWFLNDWFTNASSGKYCILSDYPTIFSAHRFLFKVRKK
jgi:hypothetical protein